QTNALMKKADECKKTHECEGLAGLFLVEAMASPPLQQPPAQGMTEHGVPRPTVPLPIGGSKYATPSSPAIMSSSDARVSAGGEGVDKTGLAMISPFHPEQ